MDTQTAATQMTAAQKAVQMKAGTRDQWDAAAAGWNAHEPVVRAWLAAATDAMLEFARVGTGDQVLDLAAGTGGQTIDIARRVGMAGTVLATDLSPACIAWAEAHARAAGLAQVRTQVADAEDLPYEAQSFDAVVCRLGLMLLPDPGRALREAWRVLRPGGNACALVFSTALSHAGLPARDPFQPGSLFSLGGRGVLDGLFRDAGFREVATTTLPAPFHLPSARHYLDFVRDSASPVREILGRLPAPAAAAAWQDIEQRLSRFDTPSGWVGPNELLLTVGRR